MKYMKDVGGGSRKRGRCDEDPMSSVANLFDVAMVFALGLMVMLLMYLSIPEVLTQTDMTIVKNPGQPNMEVIVKSGEQIEKLDMMNETVQTEITGEMGRIYKTKGGGMVYVPAEDKVGVI
ncbi:hypothetical protein C5S35_05840 [Candidatus Methanophagaceae archaeon]|nr:hypothetical protein C5S35_05840 [Methanophagales archaeon]